MNFGPLLLAVAVVSLDVQRAARVIRSGGVFVQPGWVAPAVSCALRADALALREAGAFAPSGVSNVASATKPFGSEDRVCCTLHERVGGDAAARRGVEVKLERLRAELGVALDRDMALEEMYYSIHGAGAFLGRHMDERHEACKGAAGFEAASRRSVSWILYVGEESAGGEFRAWCRESARGDVGSDAGNVQVGWLRGDTPVFLDAFVRGDGDECLYGLYARDADGRRRAVCAPFGGASEAWLAARAAARRSNDDDDDDDDDGMSADEFHDALALLLAEPHRRGYRSVEALEGARVVEVAPEEGTLVLFDSAASSHEVLATTAGERIALAGWLHEPVREPPDWW